MATDWKSILTRTATTIGRSLLFLARHLFTLLATVSRFIVLRAIPATWRWLRGSAFPAMRRFYLWLPHRRAVLAVSTGAFSIIAAVLVIQTFHSGTGADSGDRARAIEVSTREGKWVEDLLSGNWDKQKATTKTVLQHMGLKVLEDDQVPAPDDRGYIIPPELTLLAMDGAQKPTTGRITLAELAHLMRNFGFPFAEDQAPAQLLRDGVRDWVRDALEDPKQEGAQAPLFLHAMAAQQRPALDLASDRWHAEQYHLTYLELQVFLAAFQQALPGAQARQASLGDALLSVFIGQAHASNGACADLQNYIVSRGKQTGHEDLATLTNFAILKLLGTLTGKALDKAGTAGAIAKRVMIALNTAVKMQKLAMLYGSMDMSLTADQKLVHKPGRYEPGKELTFIATAGVDQDQYAEYLKQWNASPAARNIKSCLASLGLPMPTDTADIAGDVEHWKIHWDLLGGHASWGTEKNQFDSKAQRRVKLTRISATQGKASFVVDLHHEEGDHEGDQVTRYISGKATLDTERPPLIDKFVDAGKGGADYAKSKGSLLDMLDLGNIAIDIFAGALQKIIDPVKYYEVAVIDHRHRFADYSYRGTLRGHNSRYKSVPNPGWIAMNKLRGNMITHKTLSFDGEFETTTSSFTPDRQSANWYMEGEAIKSGTYDHLSHGSTVGRCVGGTVSMTVTGTRAGTQMYGTPAKLTMHSFAADGKYRIQITLNHNPGITVPYKQQVVREDVPHGCAHWGAGRSHNETTNDTRLDMASPKILVDSAVPYPEVVSGKQELREHDGSTTHWEWKFLRVDPSDNPTYVDAVGG